MTQLTDDSDRTTYSNPAAQSESAVPVAATRQLEEGKACKQRHISGTERVKKKQTKILFCRQTESDPAPDWNVKRRAAGRSRIRGDGAADRLQFGAFFLFFVNNLILFLFNIVLRF